MKKTMAIAALLVVAATFTSCKKEYSCECTTKDGSTVVSTATTTIKDTKSKAEDACNGLENTVGTLTTTCEIK